MNDVISKSLSPTSIEEVCEAVRAHNHSAIYPVGAGSWMDLGYPRTKPGVEISTLQLNRVVDYPHEELTITVEAGILISALSKILAEKGQMLPFDCPHPEKATLGGLLATNTSGPRRLAYGTARDSVLGLDVVNAQGERIHGGGRVVKNVAGYDMPKMHIGALGTLGIIVEATLKVRPMPEASEMLFFTVEPDRLDDALTYLRQSKLRPAAIEIQTPHSQARHMFQLIKIRLEDSAEAVAFQRDEASRFPRWFGRAKNADGTFPEYAELNWRSAVDGVADSTSEMIVKLTVPPTKTGAVVDRLWDWDEAHIWKLQAHAFSGVIWGFWGVQDFKSALKHASLVEQLAKKHEGRFSFPRCPDEWKRSLPIWGDVGPKIEWMRRLRDSLDPNHVLNPGRFVVE